MSPRKKRLAPPPPVIKSRPAAPPPPIVNEPFFLFGPQPEDLERTSSNSSPSRDSGLNSDSESNLTTNSNNRDEKPRSRDSSSSNRSSIVSQDSLDLKGGGGGVGEIPPAPPPILDPLIVSINHYTDGGHRSPIITDHNHNHRPSQKDLIISAKGTLKRSTSKKSTSSQVQHHQEIQFFINENNIDDDFDADVVSLAQEEQEVFAGVKKVQDGSLTIRSHRGTVRGVKNRVRAGIATFLRDPHAKNFEDREHGRIVIYITTLGILRATWARCVKVRQILRNLLIRVDERDVFMTKENQLELMDRMGTDQVILPQVFIDGQLFGDADIIEKLNETGELRHLLRPFKSLSVTSVCSKCGGFRMLHCPVCNGSKKSMHRNDFTAQFVALRCTHCDECGLVKCDFC